MTHKTAQPMLLLTVNNSIGNKKKHFSLQSLISLFTKKKLSPLEIYALETIATEAEEYEIENFSKNLHIPMNIIKEKISLYVS